jgi:hypothetical protein
MLGTVEEEAALAATQTPEELGESLIRRRHELDVLELMWSIDAARFVRTDEYDRQGFATPIDYLRVNARMTAPQVIDRLDVGLQMTALPESSMAVIEGEIGFGHLVKMARTAERLYQSTTSAPFDEAPLLAAAKEQTVGKLHFTCMDLRHSLDPEGYATEEAETVDARSLEISSGGDGMVSIRATLDSAGAAVLRKALEPLAKKSGKGDHRKRRQRLADALVDLANGAQPAQLQVITSVETLMGLAGAPAGAMEFSLPIGARTVERVACDCNLVRVLLAADSAVIDVGRSIRIVNPALRRALEARDGGCRWPGCDRSGSACEAHHVVHWAKAGETVLENLVLLCHRHHRLVHEGLWQLVRCDDGTWLTIRPPTRIGAWARGPD